jgi:hypothetical protein
MLENLVTGDPGTPHALGGSAPRTHDNFTVAHGHACNSLHQAALALVAWPPC